MALTAPRPEFPLTAMPQLRTRCRSEMPMYRFWNSGARAHLAAALDLRGACD